MKKTLFVLSLLTAASSISIAQTADEIINKNIAAMGGLDKLNSIKTIYEEDSLFAGPAKLPLKVWMINQKAMRAQFSVNGMVNFQIVRTDSGWSYFPFQGQTSPEPMTQDEVKQGLEDLYVTDAFVNYKEKGYKVTYEGKDETEGSEAFKIKVVISDSSSKTFYIDPDTYFVIQVKEKRVINGKVVEGTETRSDYKKTSDGYVFPMEVNNSNEGDTRTYVIKVNMTFDNKIFSPAVKVAGK